jgi:hypothetical protein
MRGIGLSLLIIAAGIGLFAYGGTMPGYDDTALYVVIAGAALVPIGIVLLILAIRRRRRAAYAAALAAPDAIARWQIYPSDLAAFREIDAARARRRWSLKNFLKLPRSVPPEGIPVVVGQTWLLVGDRYFDLGLGSFGKPGEVTWHDGAPGFIESHGFIPGQTGVRNIIVARILVPASAREQGLRAFRHFEAQVVPHERESMRRHFGQHWEAVDQVDDSPHPVQRRRTLVLSLIALWCLAMLAIVFGPRIL